MKKLIVAAIGAVALGAYADLTVVQFDDLERGSTTLSNLNESAGTYWDASGDNGTNEFKVSEFSGLASTATLPKVFEIAGVPTNQLDISTASFESTASLYVQEGGASTNIGSGLYFDSLVKFTVCEDEMTAEYDDAKIVMWLAATNDTTGAAVTNLYIKAGYLSIADSEVAAEAKVYNCGAVGLDLDSFHRVTIKAINDITSDSNVPGFVVFIDSQMQAHSETDDINDSTFTYSLNDSAEEFDGLNGLFPSLVQGGSVNKQKLSSVSFSGVGYVADLSFVDEAPFTDAADKEAKKWEVDGTTYARFEDALEAAVDAGTDKTLTLKKNYGVEGPLTINNANTTITIDLNGHTITNTASSGYLFEIQTSAIITNSSETAGIVYSDFVDQDGYPVENGGAINVGENGDLTIAAGVIYGWIEGDFDAVPGVIVKYEDNAGHYYDAAPVEGLGEMYVITVPTYTVTFVFGNGDANFVTNVEENATVEVPANPTRSGYTFNGWSPATTSDPIVENTIFTAQWTANEYTIEYVTEFGDNLTNETYTVEAGTINLPEPTYTGYTFEGWTNATVTTLTKTYEVQAADVTFYAVWTQGSTVEPIDADEGSKEYATEDAAADAATTINSNPAAYITITNAAGESVVSDWSTYGFYVQAVVKGTTVTLEFTTEGETAASNSVEAAVAALPVADAAADDATATISTVAGFYYSITTNTVPSAEMGEYGERTVGTGSTIELTMPNLGTKGFYKVKVSPTKK